ncbi:ABC transporter substrate-binding protein, partial [Vibrio hepatarius]|uniref:ABC transporter substrate-binding protein n=1 Tax=Vibrio hepatarius TaxID=171383 RepID=UPI0016A131CA
MGIVRKFVLGCTLALSASYVSAAVVETSVLVGFGEAKYQPDFTHFDYVNPEAPKYGTVTFGQVGTYDNFNRFASRGVSAAGTLELYDTLMYSPSDEIDAYYPLIAESVRYSDDYTWLELKINPKARFHDGEPITAHDVAFTFDKFMKEGVPQYRVYYQDIKSVTAKDNLTVRIDMAKPNREKLFSFAQSARVLPKHFWQERNLSEPLSEPPVGSGAYKITDGECGGGGGEGLG